MPNNRPNHLENPLNIADWLADLQKGLKAYSLLVLFNACLAAGVFILDTSVPMGIATGMLYGAPVAWLAMWSSKRDSSLVIAAAALCTILAVVGFFLGASDGVMWIGIVNRMIAIFVIWITAILSVMRKQAEEETKILRGLLPICSYCKKVRDHKGYWKQIEVYIAANSQADFTHGLCPECGVEHYPEVFKGKHTGT